MFDYPVKLEPGDETGVLVASFPDVPEAITEGDGEAHTLEQAAEALGLALLTYLRVGRPLPAASKGRVRVSPPAAIAAKLALLSTFKAAGISGVELARRLGKDEKQVRRILDPKQAKVITDIGTLEATLASMGQKLVISIEPS